MSCDAYALDTLGQEEMIPYGLTLLYFSKMIPQSHYYLNTSSYYKSKKQIGRRILMIKNFKKGSYKITAAALMLCLLFGLGTLANAAGTNFKNEPVDTAVQNANSKDDPIRAALGNSKYMFFNSLERAQNYVKFPFKVPDYLPSGFGLYSINLNHGKIENNDLLVIGYWSTTDGGRMISSNEEHHFSLSISQSNLLQAAKSVKDATYDEEKMNIGGFDATSLTIHAKQDVNNKDTNFVILDTIKHLIWQDGDTWYDLEYYVSSIEKDGNQNIYENMPLDKMIKTVSSMTYPENVKNINYTSDMFKNSFAIYNQADLNNAAKLLGFAPKFPININGFAISSAHVNPGIYFENDQDTPILTAKYTETAGETIQIEQTRLSSQYDSIVKNGYTNYWNTNTNKNEAVESKTVNIGGISVFAFDVAFANEKTYVWAQNGIYYSASFSGGINQTEAIVNTFITLNS
jgi:bla regulator protein BlaR1